MSTSHSCMNRGSWCKVLRSGTLGVVKLEQRDSSVGPLLNFEMNLLPHFIGKPWNWWLPAANDLSWLKVEAVARATGTPQWFGPVLAVEAGELLPCPCDLRGEPTGWCVEAIQAPGKSRQHETI